MYVTKYLNPQNDVAFEHLFLFDENKEIRLRFLNDIFGRTTNPIEQTTILKRPQDPKISSQRTCFVEVSCRDAEGNHLIIQLQVAKAEAFLRGAPYYATKAYLEPRDKGICYQDVKEVILLAIADFVLFPDNPDYLSHHITLGKETIKDFSFSFLELPKFNKKKEELVSLTEKWAFFFKHALDMEPADIPLVAGPDQIIAKAFDIVNRFHWNRADIEAYDDADMQWQTAINILKTARIEGKEEGREEVIAEGRKEGMVEGMAEGSKEGIVEGMQAQGIEVAKRMLADSYKVEEITRITGLSKDQLDNL